VTATSPAATTDLGGAVSTTSPLALTLRPVAFCSPMPVSSLGKAVTGNVEVGLLGSKGSISKLSKLFASLTRTNFVPGTDARVI